MLRHQILPGSQGSISFVMADSAGLAQQVAEEGPVVITGGGAVRGRFHDGLHVLKGIPFASPPVGGRRLQPPEPPEHWEGIRDGLAFGPKPPQLPYPPFVAELLPEFVGPGDD